MLTPRGLVRFFNGNSEAVSASQAIVNIIDSISSRHLTFGPYASGAAMSETLPWLRNVRSYGGYYVFIFMLPINTEIAPRRRSSDNAFASKSSHLSHGQVV